MVFGHEIRRLKADHAELHALSSLLLASCDARQPAQDSQIVAIVQQYCILLTRHLKCEDWILYPCIEDYMGLSVRRLAEDILADYGDLSTRLAAYEQRWSGAELTQDWAHFCCDTIALLHHAAARTA